MKPEHFRVRLDGRRLIVAVMSSDRVREIDERLRSLGCSEAGPAAWHCDDKVGYETLAATVGELAPAEIIYLASHGSERMEVAFLAAPNTDGGIIVAET
ncbi:MAG TPA: hypothetical protein VGX37_09300 [Allosphingosinicella sp.]|nr:hypothetical protein [Allosphingosinicella sp.]